MHRETATEMFKLLDKPSFLLLEKLSVAVLQFHHEVAIIGGV